MSEPVGFIKVEFFSDGSNKISHDLVGVTEMENLSVSLSSYGVNFSLCATKKTKKWSKKKKSDEDLKLRIMNVIADADKPISVICQRARSKQYSEDEVVAMVELMESEGVIKKVEISHPKKGTSIRYAVA